MPDSTLSVSHASADLILAATLCGRKCPSLCFREVKCCTSNLTAPTWQSLSAKWKITVAHGKCYHSGVSQSRDADEERKRIFPYVNLERFFEVPLKNERNFTWWGRICCQIRLTHNLENDKELRRSLSPKNITVTEITWNLMRLYINADATAFFFCKK